MRSSVILLLSLAMITPVFAAPQEIEIPQDPWEPIFFHVINWYSEKAGWTPLRQMDIPNGAIEVRVWSWFGFWGSEGLLLRRDGDQWLGLYTRNGFEVREVHPETSWNALWKRVEALGILTLPDSSTLPGEADSLDGIGYVVEINDGKLYRTYHYDNPQGQEWPEAEKIIEIVKTLYGELLKKDSPSP